ncbi:MAG: four helix bundle protein [Succinivibrionaceae bacterium]|nr:four helix bundle protein [Succinivibrionaceae bacterium]
MEDDILLDGQHTLQLVEKLIDTVDRTMDHWPYFYKMKYGLQISNHLTHMEELCVAANKKYFKKTTLQELDITNTQLKFLIRRVGKQTYRNKRGDERKLLPDGLREEWDSQTVEIGKRIGAWIKSQGNK